MLSAPSKYKPEIDSKADIIQDKGIHVQSSNKFQTLSKIDRYNLQDRYNARVTRRILRHFVLL